MLTIILKYSNVKFCHLMCILSFFHYINGNQHVQETTLDPKTNLKYLEDKANQELEKINFCNKSNITNLILELGNNEIGVFFKLRDEKFQDCYEYFKIYLEKNRRIIRKVKIPYSKDKQKSVAYTFTNIPCGIYEVFVRPCNNDRSCPQFRWKYANPINVTSESCLGILKNTNISNTNKNEEIIVISSVFAFIFLGVISGLASYCYLSGKQKLKNFGDNASISEYKYSKIDTAKDKETEIKSLYIYIFHPYSKYIDQDERKTLESKVEELKNLLTLLLQHLFDAKQKSSMYSSIKTIQSELPKILFNVDNWLKDALNKKEENGILRKIILVESEKEEENEDSLENLIYSEIIDKLRSDKSRCVDGYDSLFVVQLHDRINSHVSQGENYNSGNSFTASVIPTYSDEIKDIVRRCRYCIYADLVDLCIHLCSGSILKTLEDIEDKNNAKILLQHHLNEYLSSIQNV